MVVLTFIIILLLVGVWLRAGKEVELPAQWEYELIRWKEKFPPSPLITKTIELGDQVEFNVLEALNISQQVEYKNGKGAALQIQVVSSDEEEKNKFLVCLSRRFPEVGFLPCENNSEEDTYCQELKV